MGRLRTRKEMIKLWKCSGTYSGYHIVFIDRAVANRCGLKMDDKTITTDPSMKAEIFNKFFGSVFTVDNGLCSDVNNRAVDDGLRTITFTP